MRFVFLTLLANVLFLLTAYGQKAIFGEIEKPMSSYFLIQEELEAKNFPLLLTKADVVISAMIADVTVTQVYINRSGKPIEALYVFPASTRAAIYDLQMKIGSRFTKAEVHPKKKAREMYEEARQEGRSTSLLEQFRPNVFTMNVANILPGDTITVTLKYTEHLLPESLMYEFVFPTVVGPRFLSKESPESHSPFDELTYVTQKDDLMYDFDINVTLNTFIPIKSVASNSHKILTKQSSPHKIQVTLDKSEVKSGNRDFILSYIPVGDKIETGLILHEDGQDKYFMLVVQAPKRVSPQEIVPREYVFVLDVSGSMNGFPISISKEAMEQLLRRLRPDDLFNLILFASGTELFSPQSLPASDKNLADALAFVNKKHGYGGTEIMPALKLALATPVNAEYSKSIIVMTDGLVGVDKEAVNYIRDNLSNANLYTFGIGNSINRFLLEAMAFAGSGEPLIITKPEGAEEMAKRFLQYIESPVMTDVSIEFDGFLAYDVEPKKPFDLTAERPIVVYGKYTGTPSGNIKLRGKTADQTLSVNIPIEQFGIMDNSPAVKYLFARNQLKMLETYSNLGFSGFYLTESPFEELITELGMKYNLLTEYTSFVAVDYEIRNETGEYQRVHQRLPVPEGMVGTIDFTSADGVAYGSFQSNITLASGVVESRATARSATFDKNAGGTLDTPLLPTYEYSATYGDIEWDDPYMGIELQENILLSDIESIQNMYQGKILTKKGGKLDRIEFSTKIDNAIRKEIEKKVTEEYHKALKSAKEKPKNELSLSFTVNVKLPEKFRLNLNDKEFPVKNLYNVFIVETVEGKSEPILMGKQAEIHITYLDKDFKEIAVRNYNDVLGFGVIPDGISLIANKLPRGSERLLLLRYAVDKRALMDSEVIVRAGEIKYIKLKVM